MYLLDRQVSTVQLPEAPFDSSLPLRPEPGRIWMGKLPHVAQVPSLKVQLCLEQKLAK